MNMMVNTSDLLNEADTELNKKNAQKKALSKLLAAWESKSAQKAKTFGGLGFLAVSLAACNSSSDDTATTATTPTTPAEPTTPTVVTNTPQALTASTTADMLVGDGGNDTFSGDATTYGNGDQIVDTSTTDADTFTLTFNATSTPNIRNVETLTIEHQNIGAANLDASLITGAQVLNFSRGDVTIGGSTISGLKSVVINNLDGSQVPTINITGTATTVDINGLATDAGGAVINANTATSNVTYNNAGTINANASTGHVQIDGGIHAASQILASAINAAVATQITTSNLLKGTVTISAPEATQVDVNMASGGGSVSAAKGGTTGITVIGIDSSGYTVTTGSYASTAAGTINLQGTTATSDTATVSGAGSINLNVAGATGAIDIVTLGANGANVTYTITATAAEALTFQKAAAASGSQASTFTVTAAGNEARFSGKTVTDIDTLDLTAGTAGAIDGGNWTVGTVDLGFDNGANAITYNEGAVYEITADQANSLSFDSKAANTTNNLKIIAGDDNGTSTAVGTIAITGSLDLSGGAAASTADDVRSGTVTIEAIKANVTLSTGLDIGKKMNVVITGDEDVNLGTISSGGNATTAPATVDASASTGIITATLGATMPTLTTGSGADVITVDAGTDIHTVVLNGGADTLHITNTAAGSSFGTGDGDDTINVDDADVIVVSGGAGNDTFNTTANLKATIAGGDGTTDTLLLDTAATTTFDEAFRMSGIEVVDITAANNVTIMDPLSFASDNTFALKGNAAADIFRVIPQGATNLATAQTIDASQITVASGSTVTIQYQGGTKADTITGGVAAETFTFSGGGDNYEGGSTGTDTFTHTTTANAAGTVGITAGTAASVGYILNLGTTTLSSGSIYAGIASYAGNGQDVAASKGMHAYAAAAATNDTDTDTVSGMEVFNLGDGKDYFQGSSEAETIHGAGGADYLNGGDGADVFIYKTTAELVATNAVVDQIVGGLGSDVISIDNSAGTTFAIAATDDLARISTVDTIRAHTATDNAITIDLHNDAHADGITTVDLSLDTSATGNNVINTSVTIAAGTTGYTIKGGAGQETITGSSKNDTVTTGAGTDDFVFAAAASNGTDSITDFDIGGSADDLNIVALITGTITGDIDGVGADDGDLDLQTIVGTGRGVGVDNGVIFVYNEGGTLAASDIAVAAADGKLVLANNGEMVVLTAALSTSTEFDVYYVADTDAGGTQTYTVTKVADVTLDTGHTAQQLVVADLVIA